MGVAQAPDFEGIDGYRIPWRSEHSAAFTIVYYRDLPLESGALYFSFMSSPAFQRLAQFLRSEMRMSHIYQPLMLKLLLERGGQAATRDIAVAFLSHDESQLDYYETIINRMMPGAVLRKHGLVSRDLDGYALAPHLHELSDAERTDLVRLCDDAIAAYKTKRGTAIWEHRAHWPRPNSRRTSV